MPRWSAAWLVIALALFASSCIRKLQPLPEGAAIPPGKILMLGRIALDPDLDVHITAVDPGGFMNKVNLMFTDEPNKPFDEPEDTDFYAANPPGRPFAVLIDRKNLFVRGVHMQTRWHVSMRGTKITGTDFAHVLCTANYDIEPVEGDRAIYVGLFLCHHEQQQPNARSYDEWKAMEPLFRKYVDTSIVKMRFPRGRP